MPPRRITSGIAPVRDPRSIAAVGSNRSRARNEIRRNLGLSYVADDRAVGLCWICHFNPPRHTPFNEAEYRIWRARRIPLACSRPGCSKIFKQRTGCDTCGAHNAYVISHLLRGSELLRRYNVIQCMACYREFGEVGDVSEWPYCRICHKEGVRLTEYDVSHIDKAVQGTYCDECLEAVQRKLFRDYWDDPRLWQFDDPDDFFYFSDDDWDD